MEKAIYLNNLTLQEDKHFTEYDQVYYGAEFCEKKIPTKNEIIKIMDYIGKSKQKISLLTPPCTKYGLDRIEELLKYYPAGNEIIFNDWGVLKLIDRNKYIPVLGRLLVTIKRDPRIKDINNPDESYKYSNVNSKEFQNILLENNINRIELDNVYQGYNFDLDQKIKTSLIYPLVYITTSRKCLISAAEYAEKVNPIRDNCGQLCDKYLLTANIKNYSENIFIDGNTNFYLNNEIINDYNNYNTDRLVYYYL